MRLLATAAGIACALFVLPAAAAGQSPKPFDFELAARAPAGAAAASRSGGPVVSSRLRTGRRFNLVGMRWRGRAVPAIRLRVHQPGRGWSHWHDLAGLADLPDPQDGERPLSASDPLWVGTADGIQYRLSRNVPGLRLHFVNVSAEVRRTQARAAQTPPTPGLQPTFVSRAQWGAAGCQPRTAPSYGTVKAVEIHHTVSLNDYSPAEAPAIVLAICRYHRNSNGWNDIGYNALVDKYGVLYEGRAGGLDQPVIGAQAQGFNAQTAGIASIGDHTMVGATPQELTALANYARWKLQVHAQPVSGRVTLTSAGGASSRYAAGVRVTLDRVIGHRDTGKTECPGQLLYAQLANLRSMMATGVGAVPTYSTRLAATLAHYDLDFGQVVPLTGLLFGPTGGPLAGEQVEVQVNGDGRWETKIRVTTAANGAFATQLKPSKRLYVRLLYPGRAQLRSAFSPRLLLRLHPVVVLSHPPNRAVRGARVPVQGTVGPSKRVVYLVLQQRIRGHFRKVGAKAVRSSHGRFRTSFVPAFSALYRYAVVAKSDLDTDRGSSGWKTLRARG